MGNGVALGTGMIGDSSIGKAHLFQAIISSFSSAN